jgi:hypothetical protein
MKNLTLALIATLFALLLGEVAVRVAVVALHRSPLVVSDADAGWTARPNLHNLDIAASGGHFASSTDSVGHRLILAPTAPRPHSDRDAVLLVGDSFVYGLSVADSETVANQLARSAAERAVVNLGVPGYGTDQELVSLEKYYGGGGTRNAGDVVIVVFENDFRDVQRHRDPWLGYAKPVYAAQAGVLERPTFHRPVWELLMDHSRLVWLVVTKVTNATDHTVLASDAGEDMVVSCVTAMRKLSEAREARVHVVAHRRLDQASSVSEPVWRDFLRRTAATDITDSIRVAGRPSPLSFDGVHWSFEGNRRVAELIRRML